ncbi:GrpB family protein [Haloarcula sp. H-GB4]|uniref:GrpB family protein n=1 Tax=Haloarcula sp. H-GB4 TaxID=3069755 RepID=UPI0027AFDF9D|nr:GrpB family protein [Haloarcula sp. H-GB4]MDQ2074540.1 GrpB family protein [Haloarcula sp. H-GB4]
MIGLERGTVELVPYQAEWKPLYEKEVAHLKAVAGERLLDFEHIGSTAIEGVPAKPIIDILAVVEDLKDVRGFVRVLEENGYEYRPDDDVHGRLFFAKGPRTNRTHYLSLTEWESDFYHEKIAFREYLREHPEVAEQYASVKRALAQKYPKTRDKYTAEKSDFIQDVLDRAMSE